MESKRCPEESRFVPAPAGTGYRGPVVVSSMEFGGRTIRLIRPADPDQSFSMTRSSSPGIGMTTTCRTGRISGPLRTCWPRPSNREPWLEGLAESNHVEALEIGCGLGLAGLVAVARGLRVQFTDYDQAPWISSCGARRKTALIERFSTRGSIGATCPMSDIRSSLCRPDLRVAFGSAGCRSAGPAARAWRRGLVSQPLPRGRERVPGRTDRRRPRMSGRGGDGPNGRRPIDRRDPVSSDAPLDELAENRPARADDRANVGHPCLVKPACQIIEPLFKRGRVVERGPAT